MSRIANISAALLLGGASRRMGRDKARLELRGEPAATRLANVLASLFEDVMLVGGDAPSEAPGRRVPDQSGPACALRGVASALAAAREERVLVLATDLMAMTADLLLAIAAYPEADAVVPRSAGFAHPLCALYRRVPALAAAQRCLASESLALQSVLAQLDVRWFEGADLAAIDPEGTALGNINTPDDYARLLARESAA